MLGYWPLFQRIYQSLSKHYEGEPNNLLFLTLYILIFTHNTPLITFFLVRLI